MVKKGKTAPKRRGRPPLPAGQGKRASFTTRLREDLKKRLEDTARRAGHSLSEEIEFRLERSFLEQDIIEVAAFGGRDRYLLMKLLATGITLLEEETSGKWNQNATTFSAVKGMINSVLESFQPEGARPGEIEFSGIL